MSQNYILFSAYVFRSSTKCLDQNVEAVSCQKTLPETLEQSYNFRSVFSFVASLASLPRNFVSSARFLCLSALLFVRFSGQGRPSRTKKNTTRSPNCVFNLRRLVLPPAFFAHFLVVGVAVVAAVVVAVVAAVVVLAVVVFVVVVVVGAVVVILCVARRG